MNHPDLVTVRMGMVGRCGEVPKAVAVGALPVAAVGCRGC
jgi:hypothetical protein